MVIYLPSVLSCWDAPPGMRFHNNTLQILLGGDGWNNLLGLFQMELCSTGVSWHWYHNNITAHAIMLRLYPATGNIHLVAAKATDMPHHCHFVQQGHLIKAMKHHRLIKPVLILRPLQCLGIAKLTNKFSVSHSVRTAQ